MPGLTGCVSTTPLDPRLLKQMVKPLLHRPSYGVVFHTEEKFLAASVNLSLDNPNGMAQSFDNSYLLFFYGDIYEPWAGGRKIASELLDRWLRGGNQALQDLNGEYLVLIWDSVQKRLTIINDRLGLKRLHYWTNGHAFAWAPEVKAIAVISEVSRQTDEQALAELLTFGHLQDDRTLLRDVKLLPPASCLTWHDGKITFVRYWNYVCQADPALSNHERAVDEYYSRVETAVARRLKGLDRTGLFLSGGLDSRTLGGMMKKVRPDLELFTWTAGHGHDHDSRFGARIARAIGSEHKAVAVPETFLTDYGADFSWVLDGMVSTHGAHRSCLIEEAIKTVPIIFLGFMGDTVSGGKPLDYVYQISDVDELTQKAFSIYEVGFNDTLFKKLLKKDVYDRVSGSAYKSFARAMRNARVEFPADRIVHAELVQRQRLFNPPAQMDLQGIDCSWATPFTDKEFIDFSLRLPWQERLHKKAYLGMLCKYFPELTRIPRSGEGLPIVHSRIRASIHWRWVLLKRRFNKHHYGAFVHCAEWFRKSSADFIRSKLIHNPILQEQFKTEELNQMIESFLNNTAERDLMDSIAALMSYALFRERLDTLPRHELNPVSQTFSRESQEVRV